VLCQQKLILFSHHYVREMSINDELDDFFFKSKMTTINPLLSDKLHLSTDSIIAITVGVVIIAIGLFFCIAYMCKKFTEVTINLFFGFIVTWPNHILFLIEWSCGTFDYAILRFANKIKQYAIIHLDRKRGVNCEICSCF
jgi:hypothetical protein